MVITEIKKGKRGNSLLFGDGQYLMSLKDEVLIKSGVKVGTHIDESVLNNIKKISEICKAKEKALNLLSYRGRSKKELKDRIARDTDEIYASLAVEKMESLGLINDVSFAEQYAQELLFNKRCSFSLTRYKLREKGISEEIIDSVLSKIDVNEDDQVLFLLNNKFYKKIKDEKSKKRVINTLSRLGYSWSVIKNAFSALDESVIEDETT